MLNYYTIPPAPALSDFVRLFWVLESDQPYTHFGMADVCPEMVFHYQGQFDEIGKDGILEKSFLAGVSGSSSSLRRFRIDAAFGIFGVYLFPDALRRLFGIPAYELTDEMPDLLQLLGAEGHALQSRILSARDNAERKIILVAAKHLSPTLSGSTRWCTHRVVRKGWAKGVSPLPRCSTWFEITSLIAFWYENRMESECRFFPRLRSIPCPNLRHRSPS